MNNFSPQLIVETIAVSMTYASGYSNTSKDISKSGYTPIAIVGFALGSSYYAPSAAYIQNNSLIIEGRNHSSASYSGTANASAKILYVKS